VYNIKTLIKSKTKVQKIYR